MNRPASPTASRRAIVMLLAVLVAIGIVTETGTRQFVVRASRIERRVESEYANARHIRRAPGVEQVLVAGNSLLLTDVVFDSLRAALAPARRATRLVIEQTTYYDWFYGTRALLARGALPDVLVLVLTRQHVLASGFRGDYSVYRLMRTADVPDLARDLRLHPTVATGYLLSSVSAFYGLRGELRKVFLSRVLPDVREFTQLLTTRGVVTPPDSTSYQAALTRLRRLKSLTDQYGVRLVIVTPPTPSAPPPDDPVAHAAAAAGVAFLEPTPPGTFVASDFADGFHMTGIAAGRFTRALTIALLTLLDGTRLTPESQSGPSAATRPGGRSARPPRR